MRVPTRPTSGGRAPSADGAAGGVASLFVRHADEVRGYARLLIGEQAADDVVSETFIVALRRADAIPDPALPWLLAVARNVARTHARAARRHGLLASQLAPLTPGPDTDSAEDVETRSVLLEALGRLNQSDRALLLFWAWTDLEASQAAQQLGCSVTAYYVRLHRARTRLRKMMEGEE